MKYAKEVIALMGANPGTKFRMAQIIRYVTDGDQLTAQRRNAVRQGVLRVLDSLQETGQVYREAMVKNSVYYVWYNKVRHEVGANVYANCDNRG